MIGGEDPVGLGLALEASGSIDDLKLKAIQLKALPGKARMLEGPVFEAPAGILALDEGNVLGEGSILLMRVPERLKVLDTG